MLLHLHQRSDNPPSLSMATERHLMTLLLLLHCEPQPRHGQLHSRRFGLAKLVKARSFVEGKEAS